MIQTDIVGAVMLALYVVSGSLWISMVLHAVIDVNSGLYGAWLLRRVRAEEASQRDAGGQ